MLFRSFKWLSVFILSTSLMAIINLISAPGIGLQILHIIGLPLLGLCGARALKLSVVASGGTFIENSIADGMVEFIPVRMSSFEKVSRDLVSNKYACLKAEHSLQAPGLAEFMEWCIRYEKASQFREGFMPCPK